MNVTAFTGGGGDYGGGGAGGGWTGGDNGGELPVDAGVLDAIAKAEGTYGSGYNTSLGYGKYLPGGKEQTLTDKSLQEIIQLGNYMRKQKGNPNSSALGRYQIVGTTLKDAAKALKLDLNSTKFTPEVQDRLAMWILKRQGFGAWEGFKRNPELLQFANQALTSGRIKGTYGNSQLTGGQLTNPLPGYPVSSEFGLRPSPGGIGSTNHKGMDFKAPMGTPIAAAGSGTVVKVNSQNNNGLGLYVVIDHGNGLVTKYGHMSGITVRKGMEIAAGQNIGYVGMSGTSTGPHLHFIVEKNGVKENPRPFLTGKPKNLSPESNTPFGILLNSYKKKKKKTKTIIREKVKPYPVYIGQGPGLSPQSPNPVSGKQTNYYLN
jgi:murein DD-endopeptidase MepM/ murein hydrolase activator NlpD